MSNRREFIKAIALAGSGALLARSAFGVSVAELSSHLSLAYSPKRDGWAQVPEILKRIKAPVFARRDFVITRYGAKGDGKTDCTHSFQEAIAACTPSATG